MNPLTTPLRTYLGTDTDLETLVNADEGLISRRISCGRAVPSTCTAAGQFLRLHSVQSNDIVMNSAACSAPASPT